MLHWALIWSNLISSVTVLFVDSLDIAVRYPGRRLEWCSFVKKTVWRSALTFTLSTQVELPAQWRHPSRQRHPHPISILVWSQISLHCMELQPLGFSYRQTPLGHCTHCFFIVTRVSIFSSERQQSLLVGAGFIQFQQKSQKNLKFMQLIQYVCIKRWHRFDQLFNLLSIIMG